MNNRMNDVDYIHGLLGKIQDDLSYNLEDLMIYPETKFLTVRTSMAAHLWVDLAPVNVAGGNGKVHNNEQPIATGKQLKSTHCGTHPSELDNSYHESFHSSKYLL